MDIITNDVDLELFSTAKTIDGVPHLERSIRLVDRERDTYITLVTQTSPYTEEGGEKLADRELELKGAEIFTSMAEAAKNVGIPNADESAAAPEKKKEASAPA